MAKVYVIIDGDGYVHRVFSTREAAERCCATWEFTDKPVITAYELEDGSEMENVPIYKALEFDMSYSYRLKKHRIHFERMLYDTKPFVESIRRCEKTSLKDGRVIELYSGIIPVDHTVESDSEAEKIVQDRLEKWKKEDV